VRVDQCVSAVGVVVVPVLVCLRSSCCHVTEVGGAVGFVRLALKVTVQNYWESVDVISLHIFMLLGKCNMNVSGSCCGPQA